MQNEKTDQVWINENGKTKSNDELRSECQEWLPSQWEDYLSSIEKGQTEMLLDDPLITENLSHEDHKQGLSTLSSKKEYPKLKNLLLNALDRLSGNQREVLNYIFWENLSLSEISEKYGVSKSAIRYTRDRGLKQIAKFLLQTATKQEEERTINNEAS